MDSRAHRKLDVWTKSMTFVKDIYQATESFPKSELKCYLDYQDLLNKCFSLFTFNF